MHGSASRICLISIVVGIATIAAGSHAQEAKPESAWKAVTTSDVFGRGEDGYPQVRIPAVVVTPKGTVLAFAEARQGDDHSANDIVLKRSVDGGATWQPLQLIADMGGDSLNDPCAVVLPETGRVLLIYERYPKGFHTDKLAGGIEPAELGYGGPRNTQTFLTRSDDDGVTWSKPEDITKSLRRPDAISVGSPGVGIQLKYGAHKGRILFPLYEVMPPPTSSDQCHHCVAISDDGGVTWRVGARVPTGGLEGGTNESQVAELSDGTVIMDARQTTGNCRRAARSSDAGETWEPMYLVPDLVVPPCMGSVISVAVAGKDSVLLASMPTPDKRANGTLFVSRDGGKTWPEKQVLYPGGFAYSCLVQMGENRVGCLFERDDCAHITFAVFDIGSLLTPGTSK